MNTISIQALRQSSKDYSSSITIQGVVTGHSSKGYFLQQATRVPEISSGLFVYSPRNKPAPGHLAEVTGKITRYQARDGDKVCLQLKAESARLISEAELPTTVELDLSLLANASTAQVSAYLGSLDGMLVEIPAGLTCVAASNLYGDFVVAPTDWPGFCSPPDGVLIDKDDPHRWIPSFRVLETRDALDVFVGDRLESKIVGPLNYRASAYQVVTCDPVTFSPGARYPFDTLPWNELDPEKVTVMTLNTFNLDPKVERKHLVNDPQRDIDNDVGQRQYRNLAQAIIEAGRCPDIVALQEIQDDDGAEETKQSSAQGNLSLLAAVIKDLVGVEYAFIDSPPELHAEGGQPGGNIRNAFLYRPERVAISGELVRLGEDAVAFEDSRRPVMANFKCAQNGHTLSIINVHLASKRHQHSVFAEDRPAFDPREEQRIDQCKVIEQTLQTLCEDQKNFYVTGDFNDYEFSSSLAALTSTHSVNLLNSLPPQQRYDYNHRGRLLALMHGVISKHQDDRGGNRYQILHGNELVPIDPDSTSSDHAYVIAELCLG